MCSKEYNDITKQCPLRHCPNCGSTKIKQHEIRQFVENSWANIIVLSIFPLMFIGFFGGLITMSSSVEIRLIPFIIIIGSIFLIYYKSTIPHSHCSECKNEHFSPWIEVKLKKRILNQDDQEILDDIEYETRGGISKKLDSMSLDQKKHHKRVLVLRIASIVISAIIGIVGFVYNQEGIIEFFNSVISY